MEHLVVTSLAVAKLVHPAGLPLQQVLVVAVAIQSQLHFVHLGHHSLHFAANARNLKQILFRYENKEIRKSSPTKAEEKNIKCRNGGFMVCRADNKTLSDRRVHDTVTTTSKAQFAGRDMVPKEMPFSRSPRRWGCVLKKL